MKRIEEIELNNKTYEVYLGARELMFYEAESLNVTGKERSFLKDIEAINKNPNMTVVVLIVASTLHEKGKRQPIGVDYLNRHIDLFSDMNVIMETIGKCMVDINVKKDPSEKMGK